MQPMLGSLPLAQYGAVGSSANGQVLAAAGYPGAGGYDIFVSRNAGGDWVKASKPGPKAGLTVSISGDGQVFLASELGGLLWTSRDGANWTARAASLGNLTWGATAASYNGQRLAAAAFQGLIHTSSDQVSISLRHSLWAAQGHAGVCVASFVELRLTEQAVQPAAVDRGMPTLSKWPALQGVTWNPQPGSGSRSWGPLASSSDGMRLTAVDTSSGLVYTSSDAVSSLTLPPAWVAVCCSMWGKRAGGTAAQAHAQAEVYAACSDVATQAQPASIYRRPTMRLRNLLLVVCWCRESRGWSAAHRPC